MKHNERRTGRDIFNWYPQLVSTIYSPRPAMGVLETPIHTRQNGIYGPFFFFFKKKVRYRREQGGGEVGGNPLDMWSLHSSLLCRSPDVSANRVNLHLRPPPRILEHARRDRTRPDHPSDMRLDQVLHGAHFNPDRLRRGHYLPQKACG